ncbi:glycosyltransferase family 2 protein [Fulvivirga sedimenti]|uniref:Glycosyltransferase family 2 protein n=1 Tax=Fulvivirga sedimenti TaxID=2879465 RepID=A0A9X1L323_9BACT|nr:glycosyltransferase family 2 protein [Fulvivirga sedimenti]MCA6078781.1 glycosyltransferase family 2 protein [Fulvivirga sedimenti]
MSRPLVSIISVNYNQEAVTLDMLSSLSVYKDPLEVIVVDNGSVNNPEKEILRQFPDTIFIRSDENLGFAGGNNLGIDRATGKYLFFINNDTEITEGLIECLVDFMENNESAGGVSPKIHYFDEPGVFQFAGFKRINILTGRNSTIGTFEKDDHQYDEVAMTPYLHGAAMMIRNEAIQRAGKMPEEFFLYYEELDWSESIAHTGYELYYVPCGMIRHKESVSTGKNSPLKTYYLNRNRILFMRRNHKWLSRSIFLLFYSVISIPVNLLRHIFKGEREHANQLLKAYLWNFSHEGRVNGRYKY